MSKSNNPQPMADNTALIASIVTAINEKAAETQAAIVADGDVTQAKLDEITTVNGDISTDVQAINTHVTSENDRVLASIPSSAPIKSIQHINTTISSGTSSGTVTINAVNLEKSVVLISWHRYEARAYFEDETTIKITTTSNTYVSYLTLQVIEYA